jgi:hypothetical protein
MHIMMQLAAQLSQLAVAGCSKNARSLVHQYNGRSQIIAMDLARTSASAVTRHRTGTDGWILTRSVMIALPNRLRVNSSID